MKIEGSPKKIPNVEKVALATAVALVGIGNINAQEGPSKKESLEDKKINKVEAQAVIKEVNKENTYFASVADFNEENRESNKDSNEKSKVSDAQPLEINIENSDGVIKLEVGTFFETDLDKIKDKDEPLIVSNIENILSQITPENVKKFLMEKKSVFASADQRITYRYKGGNEELSLNRGKNVKKIVEEVFYNYQYNKNLSPEDVEQLKATSFVVEIPISNTGPENGVIYLTDIINPITGKNFTTAEGEELKIKNPELYNELLSENRKVTIVIGVENKEDSKKVKPDTNLDEPDSNPDEPSLKPDEPPIKPKVSTIKHKKKIHLDIPKYYKKTHIPKQFKTKTCVIPKPIKSHFNKYNR